MKRHRYGAALRQIEKLLSRFGARLDDRSRTSLVLARQEIANTVALLGARLVGRA